MSDEWALVRRTYYSTLDRQYPIKDDSAEEYVSDVADLMGLVYDGVAVETTLLKDREIQRELRLRTTHYVVGRIIRLGTFLGKRSRTEKTDFEAEYRRQLDALLDVDEAVFERIFRLARRISEYVVRKKGEVKERNGERIRRMARQHLHNCRFCGTPLITTTR